jgi:hypothetical protein
MKQPEANALALIEATRAINNRLWMSLLELALWHAPKEAKKILKEIRENDLEVSRLTGIIANADSE